MSSKTVCITGVTGFLGGHVVEAFLKRGYNVTATARDPTDRKCAFLAELRDQYASNGSQLRVVPADLNVPGSYDAAVAGCQTVVHVAAVIKDNYDKDPFVEIINPSVEGTRSIVNACKKAGVKRIVATSSVATIINGIGKRNVANTYTEADNNTACTPTYHTYAYAKREAEKVLSTEWTGELVTIHPSLILGPAKDKSVMSSLELIIALANREYPGVPPLNFDWVDVRDVAEAHVAAAENPKAKGRYITSLNQPGLINRFSAAINKTHPDVGAPTMPLPWIALWFASWCDKRLTHHFLYDLCTAQPGFSGAKIETELGFKYQYTTIDGTIGDTVTSLKKLGMLKKFKAPENKKRD